MKIVDDDIQRDLQLGLEGFDGAAPKRAFEALLREATPVVAAFEHLPIESAAERAREVVSRLVVPLPPLRDRKSKLLASGDEIERAGCARAHRRLVLRSFLLDEYRKKRTRREYEAGYARGVSPDEIRAARARRRRVGEALAQVETAARDPVPTPSGADDGLELARELIARNLPRLLPVEYRFAVALEEGYDVWPFVDELARERAEPVGALLERVAAIRPGDDASRIRVLYPAERFPDLALAADSYRQRYARGWKKLVALVREQLS